MGAMGYKPGAESGAGVASRPALFSKGFAISGRSHQRCADAGVSSAGIGAAISYQIVAANLYCRYF
jgi:hypothetical protein